MSFYLAPLSPSLSFSFSFVFFSFLSVSLSFVRLSYSNTHFIISPNRQRTDGKEWICKEKLSGHGRSLDATNPRRRPPH
ncbi:hypothetical protein F4775DRAFT_535206 [Biscogniauxia sp. FL1348]|nr:hypothetical protein F4775DRAFT_535206 [Biscogniauxia sp. FL1348]